MDRTTAANYVTVGGKRQYQDQNLAANQQGTALIAADRTGVQEELIAGLIEATGIAPNAAVLTQVGQAVKRLAGANVTTVTASTTLTADNAGLVFVTASTAPITITLPAASAANGAPLRFRFLRTDATAEAVSFAAAGGDTFASLTWAPISAPALAQGSPVDMVSEGVSHWVVGVDAQKPIYSTTVAQSTTTGNNATYTLVTQAVTFPSVGPTGGFLVDAVGLLEGSSTGVTEQNVNLSLDDGTTTFDAGIWLVYALASGVAVGVESSFLVPKVYPPGSSATFTLKVATTGGGGQPGQVAMSSARLDIRVRNA